MTDLDLHDRAYVLRAQEDRTGSVALWTQRRLPFDTDQTPEQKAMVRAVADVVARWNLGPSDEVHGLFASGNRAKPQPDAENITFYNWRGGGRSPFSGPATLRFERSYSPPPPPTGSESTQYPYFHEWSLGREGWTSWEVDGVLAEWDKVPVDVAFGDDAGRHVWRGLVEKPEAVRIDASGLFAGMFAIEVIVTVAGGTRGSAVDALKGGVDGSIAAFQRLSPSTPRAEDILRKHAAWARWRRPMPAERFARLAGAGVGQALFSGSPFNLNGLNPCDDRCVAGTVQVRRDHQTVGPELSGRLLGVRPRKSVV